jgi:hypothetical protein
MGGLDLSFCSQAQCLQDGTDHSNHAGGHGADFEQPLADLMVV